MQTEGLMRQRCWQTVQGVEQGLVLHGLCDLEESSGGDRDTATRSGALAGIPRSCATDPPQDPGKVCCPKTSARSQRWPPFSSESGFGRPWCRVQTEGQGSRVNASRWLQKHRTKNTGMKSPESDRKKPIRCGRSAGGQIDLESLSAASSTSRMLSSLRHLPHWEPATKTETRSRDSTRVAVPASFARSMPAAKAHRMWRGCSTARSGQDGSDPAIAAL